MRRFDLFVFGGGRQEGKRRKERREEQGEASLTSLHF